MAEAIAFRCVSKTYGDLRANDDVSFSVAAGDVHAVVGENGAGKSTLMRMLAGAETPDAGEILIAGVAATLPSPRHAALQGIGMVYQDLKVSPSLTVWENVVLGFEPRRLGIIDRAGARQAVGEMIARYRMRFAPTAPVSELSLSQRQQVEILRLLYRGARILVFDEPTAILTPSEAEHLLDAIRGLAAEGQTVLFVSHKLPEIFAVSDRLTVMRGGRVVETTDTAAIDHDRLVRLIVGQDLGVIAYDPPPPGPEVLRVEGLTVSGERSALQRLSFTVRAGTVLGVAGVAGNGQDELIGALSGVADIDEGTVSIAVGDRVLAFGRSEPADARRVRLLRDGGVAVIPQDRRGTGSAAGEQLWFSMFAGKYWRWRAGPFGLLDVGRARAGGGKVIRDFAVKAEGIRSRPEQLSGGNLQKFIVGREMAEAPRLLVAEDPTRGVDIGSARFIRQRIRTLADDGAAVVLVSTDLDELFEVADRILVLAEGGAAGIFSRGQFDREAVGRSMISHGDAPAVPPAVRAQ